MRQGRYPHALLELAKLDNYDLAAALARITAVDAETMNVQRVSVWLYTEERDAIVCEELYTLSTNARERGARLGAADYPAYFRALEGSRTVAADDARQDPRTSEFRDGYLDPLGITSMLDVPIWRGGKAVGVVCHEHIGAPRSWSSDDQDFAASIADMVALALERSERAQLQAQLRTAAHELMTRVAIIEEHDQVLMGHIDELPEGPRESVRAMDREVVRIGGIVRGLLLDPSCSCHRAKR